MSDWYFDNITEDIIYKPIDAGGSWEVFMRKLKRNSVIRKMARDRYCDLNKLPAMLANAVLDYRRSGGRSEEIFG